MAGHVRTGHQSVGRSHLKHPRIHAQHNGIVGRTVATKLDPMQATFDRGRLHTGDILDPHVVVQMVGRPVVPVPTCAVPSASRATQVQGKRGTLSNHRACQIVIKRIQRLVVGGRFHGSAARQANSAAVTLVLRGAKRHACHGGLGGETAHHDLTLGENNTRTIAYLQRHCPVSLSDKLLPQPACRARMPHGVHVRYASGVVIGNDLATHDHRNNRRGRLCRQHDRCAAQQLSTHIHPIGKRAVLNVVVRLGRRLH